MEIFSDWKVTLQVLDWIVFRVLDKNIGFFNFEAKWPQNMKIQERDHETKKMGLETTILLTPMTNLSSQLLSSWCGKRGFCSAQVFSSTKALFTDLTSSAPPFSWSRIKSWLHSQPCIWLPWAVNWISIVFCLNFSLRHLESFFEDSYEILMMKLSKIR